MNQPAISLTLVLLTIASLAAWVAALRRLVPPLMSSDERLTCPDSHLTAGIIQQVLVALIATVAAGLFAYRWLIVTGQWQPLAAHLDGLLLMSTLFAAVVLFIQSRPRLFGLSAFALPVLALILAWAVCAAAWTYKPFQLDTLHPVWHGLHLTSVYLGTLCAAVAAIAGGMYLFVQHRLKHKSTAPAPGQRLASLETLETLIIRTATLGFALLTLGMATGLIIIADSPDATHPGWWHTPKVLLAVAAWATYAVVMNVKHTTRFRGARAAWLSIVGLVLLLTVYGIVTALPGRGEQYGDVREKTRNSKLETRNNFKEQLEQAQFECSGRDYSSVGNQCRASQLARDACVQSALVKIQCSRFGVVFEDSTLFRFSSFEFRISPQEARSCAS